MWKLINPVQHYDWGSKTALTDLYGISNPHNQPMAELWMGAHPAASSGVVIDGQPQSLQALISADNTGMLGPAISASFGRLPYLFKVLCAESALSVQVHPDKRSAGLGFARENQAGIPQGSPQRNYKDDNHKPELLYALTPFLAMNGFRELSEITALFRHLTAIHPQIAAFVRHPDSDALQQLFTCLLRLQGEERTQALQQLDECCQRQQGPAWDAVQTLRQHYPDDAGRFMPLLLNVLQLAPGEAMFLHARTPHAYLSGNGLEIMANSDNVLRAGLTSKHIDIDELVASVDFSSRPASSLLTPPELLPGEQAFPVPVPDFCFSVAELPPSPQPVRWQGPRIFFCLQGSARCTAGGQTLGLSPGESLFIPASEQEVLLSGQGRIAVAYTSCLPR